jgi:hypothetical protein
LHSKITPAPGQALQNLLPTNPRYGHGRACGVGRALGVALGVGEAVGVGVGTGGVLGVGVTVGLGVGVGLAGVGVGVTTPPLGAWISTVIGEPVLKKPTVESALCGG